MIWGEQEPLYALPHAVCPDSTIFWPCEVPEVLCEDVSGLLRGESISLAESVKDLPTVDASTHQ